MEIEVGKKYRVSTNTPATKKEVYVSTSSKHRVELVSTSLMPLSMAEVYITPKNDDQVELLKTAMRSERTSIDLQKVGSTQFQSAADDFFCSKYARPINFDINNAGYGLVKDFTKNLEQNGFVRTMSGHSLVIFSPITLEEVE